MPVKKTTKGAKKNTSLTGEALVNSIRAHLKHKPVPWTPRRYLDTGSPELNAVIGNEEKGIAYGKLIEISGMSSSGKSALALDLLAAAQDDGAFTVWIDFENSWDPEWASRRGVKVEEVCVIHPYVGTFGTEKESRLTSVQEMLEEAEATMSALKKADPERPLFLVGDSVAAMLTEDEATGGLTGQNMKTQMSLPVMLSRLFRRWIGLLQSLDATAVFINQLRQNPMAWGDPFYTPGGNALPFYAHIRIRLKRAKKPRITKQGKMIGLKSILVNQKNKAGGLEQATCGFKMYQDGRSVFLPSNEIDGEKD